MPQSLAQVWLHIVFSTKNRRPFLSNEEFRSQMFKMISHHITDQNCVSASVGGHVDHVHLLIGLSRTETISKVIEKTKTATSRWAKSTPECSSTFSWQAGYAAFSVSHSLIDSVDEYIRNQEAHHQTRSFQDELRLLCEKHEIDIDEKYVWD